MLSTDNIYISAGKWVVSTLWVLDSIARKTLMDEENYEVFNHKVFLNSADSDLQIIRDNKSATNNVPRQWRLSRSVRTKKTLMLLEIALYSLLP